jgi:hypothetical protein
MSATAYGVLSWRREASSPGTTKAKEPPGVKSYIDVLAALVPSEALTFHALVLSQNTKPGASTPPGQIVTMISNSGALWWTFWACIVLSIVLYCFGHGAAAWDKWDYLRVLIPPIAFIGWTMLQPGTAFDAVWPNFDPGTRFVFALFIAIALGAFATWLSNKADEKAATTSAAPVPAS